VPELELLRPDHAPALLRFELEKRAYFAPRIGDRGDDFFADFDARHRALLPDQAAGTWRFHVLVESDGEIVVPVKLVDLADGAAELGHRIAESATGRGLATSGVRRVCELASSDYGLVSLRAGAAVDNPASQAVLAKAGFVRAGTEETDGLLQFVRDLAVDGRRR
jgi:ribosomal-protein-alanine N-acetyltransferase